MKHGSGLASAGNTTVKLPHCSQVGLKVGLSIEATFVSIPILIYQSELQKVER
jgi:hypothetical protein